MLHVELSVYCPSPSFLPPFLSPAPLPLLLLSSSSPSLSITLLPPPPSLDLWVVLTLNVIIAVVGAITVDSNIRSTYLITMGVSILYWVLFVPGALFCWFLPVYYAYKYVVEPYKYVG